jgi:hypothetical protein
MANDWKKPDKEERQGNAGRGKIHKRWKLSDAFLPWATGEVDAISKGWRLSLWQDRVRTNIEFKEGQDASQHKPLLLYDGTWWLCRHLMERK